MFSALSSVRQSLKLCFVPSSLIILFQSIWLLASLLPPMWAMVEMERSRKIAAWSLGMPTLLSAQSRTLLKEEEEIEKMSSI